MNGAIPEEIPVCYGGKIYPISITPDTPVASEAIKLSGSLLCNWKSKGKSSLLPRVFSNVASTGVHSLASSSDPSPSSPENSSSVLFGNASQDRFMTPEKPKVPSAFNASTLTTAAADFSTVAESISADFLPQININYAGLRIDGSDNLWLAHSSSQGRTTRLLFINQSVGFLNSSGFGLSLIMGSKSSNKKSIIAVCLNEPSLGISVGPLFNQVYYPSAPFNVTLSKNSPDVSSLQDSSSKCSSDIERYSQKPVCRLPVTDLLPSDLNSVREVACLIGLELDGCKMKGISEAVETCNEIFNRRPVEVNDPCSEVSPIATRGSGM
ncbi:hypothetical protein LINPERHAP2_LOCUS27427 [Linum perenne]